MFDLGSLVPLAVSVADSNGAPINATGITLTITLPDGSTTSPVVTNPPLRVGAYSYSYLPTQAGRHLVRWITNGPNTAFTDAFDVAEAAPPLILPLSELKQQLELDPLDTSMDAELHAKGAAITKALENYKREVIVQRTITETLRFGVMWNSAWPVLSAARLTFRPCISLTSVVSRDGTQSWDVVNNLYLHNDTGIIEILAGPPITGWVVFTYVAGYQIIPYNYLEGAKVLLQHVWETRRGPGGSTGVVGAEELGDWRHFTALPRKVTEWLGPPAPVVM